MLTIPSLLKRFSGLNTNAIIQKSLEDTAKDLEAVNRERMLDGIRSDGSEMPFYSFISQKVYGYPNERIKLRATGAFQEEIKVNIQGDIISTDSADEKSEMLKKRYGEFIFGTYGDYRKQYQTENLGPAVRNGIAAATGLKFGV